MITGGGAGAETGLNRDSVNPTALDNVPCATRGDPARLPDPIGVTDRTDNSVASRKPTGDVGTCPDNSSTSTLPDRPFFNGVTVPGARGGDACIVTAAVASILAACAPDCVSMGVPSDAPTPRIVNCRRTYSSLSKYGNVNRFFSSVSASK